jgi:hypothetical protein
MNITNISTINEPHVNDMRAAIEHRATWFYLLLEQFKKVTPEQWEELARQAITKCGVFHGNLRYSRPTNLPKFAGEFANELYKKIFEMDIVELNEDRFVVEFHYCPLIAAWQKQNAPEEDIPKLCDIAMDGDRGIAMTLPDYEFDLQSTIAQGDKVCRIVFTRKR